MAVAREKAEMFEGHGEDSKAPSIKKGTFLQVGTVIPMSSKGISPNVKEGNPSGGEQ
jgi:hypothetical protein